VLRLLLAVNPADPMVPSPGDQSGQGNLGGIGSVCKHRFTKDGLPQVDQVQASDQFPLDPGLHAVGVPVAV
jgi:hypothetical protein